MSNSKDILDDFQDDFDHDETALQAEADAGEDLENDFGTFEDEAGDDTQPAPAKAAAEDDPAARKKRQMIFYAIIGAVVLLGGGFAAMTLLPKNSAPQAPVASTTEANQKDMQAATQQPSVDQLVGQDAGAAPQNPAQPAAAGQAGLFENPELATQPQKTAAQAQATETAAPAQVSAATQQQGGDAVFDALAAPKAADTAAAAPVATAPAALPTPPVTATQNAGDQPPAAAWATPDATAAQPAPVAAQPAAAGEAKPKTDDPFAKLTAQPAAPAAPQSATAPAEHLAPASNAELDAANAKIAALEQELAQTKAKLNAAKDRVDTAPVSVAEHKSKPVRKTTKKASTAKKAAAHKADIFEDAYVPTRPMPALGSEQTTRQASGVELRGISNGAALVAVRGQLTEVRVGDEVSGLGRVTNIARGPNGWVVQGTRGSAGQ